MHKGFTLIELLVVIAIIGVLSAILTVSVLQVRQKSNDTAVLAEMNTIRAQAEIVFSREGSYDQVCAAGGKTDSLIARADSHVISLIGNDNNRKCQFRGRNNKTWGYAVKTKTGKIWCVDSEGTVRDTNSSGQTYGVLFDTDGDNPALNNATGGTTCN